MTTSIIALAGQAVVSPPTVGQLLNFAYEQHVETCSLCLREGEHSWCTTGRRIRNAAGPHTSDDLPGYLAEAPGYPGI